MPDAAKGDRDARGFRSELGAARKVDALSAVNVRQPARPVAVAARNGAVCARKSGGMSERGPHPAGARDEDGPAGQRRALLEPAHRLLREVATRGGATGARTAAGGDLGVV